MIAYTHTRTQCYTSQVDPVRFIAVHVCCGFVPKNKVCVKERC